MVWGGRTRWVEVRSRHSVPGTWGRRGFAEGWPVGLGNEGTELGRPRGCGLSRKLQGAGVGRSPPELSSRREHGVCHGPVPRSLPFSPPTPLPAEEEQSLSAQHSLAPGWPAELASPSLGQRGVEPQGAPRESGHPSPLRPPRPSPAAFSRSPCWTAPGSRLLLGSGRPGGMARSLSQENPFPSSLKGQQSPPLCLPHPLLPSVAVRPPPCSLSTVGNSVWTALALPLAPLTGALGRTLPTGPSVSGLLSLLPAAGAFRIGARPPRPRSRRPPPFLLGVLSP